MDQVLHGLRNGLEYGARLRFVHSVIITFLFKSFTKQSIKAIFMNAFEHGKNLGLFVLIYKAMVMFLNKIRGKRSSNTFIAGCIGGGIIFGRAKTPINYQIILYLFSRVLVSSVELAHKKLFPDRHLHMQQPQQDKTQSLQDRIHNAEHKIGYWLLAAMCWGLVMWLFRDQQGKERLQDSLRSSMKFLYLQSQKIENKDLSQYIPYLK